MSTDIDNDNELGSELIELMGKVHCNYCATEIWLDYSEVDYAAEDSWPIVRNKDNGDYLTNVVQF